MGVWFLSPELPIQDSLNSGYTFKEPFQHLSQHVYNRVARRYVDLS